MAKINGCLKCLFIFFNVLFAIFGCVLIYGALHSTAQIQQLSTFRGSSLGWIWVFALGVLAVSSLGIYAATSEKPVALKVFAGFMGVGMVIMVIFGIIIVVEKNKEDPFQTPGVTEILMEDEDYRVTLHEIQESDHCCGLLKAEDWGSDIPASCSCQAYGPKCTARPQGTTGPDTIYKQPCSAIIMYSVNFIFHLSMGICFAFAVTALLGLLISLLMIHQVKRHDNMGAPAIAMSGY